MHRLLAHIFDNSACLTKRQLKDYVTGVMSEEECYAVERHANDCSFCSEAIEGLSMHSADAINQLELLTPEFIQDHFQKNLPPVHLNAIASAGVAGSAPAKHKRPGISRLHISALAATLLLSFFLIRGWRQQEPGQQSTLPATVADTTPVITTQKPAKAEIKKKTIVPPPAEKRERSVPAETSAEAVAATEAPLNAKPAAAIQESNKPADTTHGNNEEKKLPDNKVVREVNMATAAAPGKDSINHQLLADEAFEQAHYTRALRHYRQILNDSTASQEDRHTAGIRAARCYILLGSKAQAVALLREIVDGNGPQSGEAGKLLVELN